MRTYGEIDNVSFEAQGFSIYELAEEYKLWKYGLNKTVYVNSMTELKAEIAKFNQEQVM